MGRFDRFPMRTVLLCITGGGKPQRQGRGPTPADRRGPPLITLRQAALAGDLFDQAAAAAIRPFGLESGAALAPLADAPIGMPAVPLVPLVPLVAHLANCGKPSHEAGARPGVA